MVYSACSVACVLPEGIQKCPRMKTSGMNVRVETVVRILTHWACYVCEKSKSVS